MNKKKTIQITQKISQIIYVGKENLKISKEDQIKHTKNKNKTDCQIISM